MPGHPKRPRDSHADLRAHREKEPSLSIGRQRKANAFSPGAAHENLILGRQHAEHHEYFAHGPATRIHASIEKRTRSRSPALHQLPRSVAEGRGAPELSSLGTLLQPLLDFHPTIGSYSGKIGSESPNDETPLARTHAPTGHTTVNSTAPQPFPDCGEQDPSA
jgi:hypothetical protein